MEDAERALEQARTDDAMLVYSTLAAHLEKIMEPIFAMGPAWTLMRAVGPHVDDQEMEDHLLFASNPNDARNIENRVRDERLKLSHHIHASLDFWSGDKFFEEDMRLAVKAVADKYKDQQKEAVAHGRRARSIANALLSARPETTVSRKGVLGF